MVKCINFLLYSNIYIALCAVAMTAQTLLVQKIDWKTSPALIGLVFFSTLVIYALHRLVSIQKVKDDLGGERFQVITTYKTHIQIYAALSVIGGGLCFLFLKWATQLALILPAVLSLAYVIPFLGSQKLRLRDIHFVKIFLIAVVWAYVTVLLPVLEFEKAFDVQTLGMLIERMLFIFLITLPFDLRDWEIDKHNNVRTIPATIGVQNTIYLAHVIVALWLGIIWFIYAPMIAIPLTISGLSTGFLVYCSPKQKHDYYFTALMDGTMILQWFLVWSFAQ